MRDKVNRLTPTRQNVWRLPAVLNFTLGGLGSGMYIVGTFWSYLYDFNTVMSSFYKIGAPLLVILGLFAVSQEAGRPSRAIYLLRNWKKSWMSRETLAAVIFVPSCLLELIFPTFLFSLPAIISGLVFLICQGMIIYKSRGLPAWNTWLTVALFIVSGIFAGSGLLMAVSIFSDSPSVYLSLTTLGFLLLGMILWPVYLHHSDEDDFQFAIQRLYKNQSKMIIRHLVPIVLITTHIITEVFASTLFIEFESYLLVLAGIMTVPCAFYIRNNIITKAGYYRQVVLYNTSIN